MDWTQVMIIIGANMAVLLWPVRQARKDFLHNCRIIESILSERNRFHDRLYTLEEELSDKKMREILKSIKK